MKYDNYTTQSERKRILKIANCRGKKPVLADIAKARKIISEVMIEINPCEGKEALQRCERELTAILSENI